MQNTHAKSLTPPTGQCASFYAKETGKIDALTRMPIHEIFDQNGTLVGIIRSAINEQAATDLHGKILAMRAAATITKPPPPALAPDNEEEESGWTLDTRVFDCLTPNDDHLYHVTTATNAKSIAAFGLRPNSSTNFTFAPCYHSYSNGKSFLTEASGVSFWKYKIESAIEHTHDRPAKVAVVRIPKRDIQIELQPDTAGTQDARANAYFATQTLRKPRLAGDAHNTDREVSDEQYRPRGQ